MPFYRTLLYAGECTSQDAGDELPFWPSTSRNPCSPLPEKSGSQPLPWRIKNNFCNLTVGLRVRHDGASYLWFCNSVGLFDKGVKCNGDRGAFQSHVFATTDPVNPGRLCADLEWGRLFVGLVEWLATVGAALPYLQRAQRVTAGHVLGDARASQSQGHVAHPAGARRALSLDDGLLSHGPSTVADSVACHQTAGCRTTQSGKMGCARIGQPQNHYAAPTRCHGR